MISTMLRPLYDNSVGDRIRQATRIAPPVNIRPLSRAATVSDLFLWRAGERWETCFELVNIPSLLAPHDGIHEEASLVIYDSNGGFVGEHRIVLSPFERRRLLLNDFVAGYPGHGTFACFHSPPATDILRAHRSYLSERGYTGYKRVENSLWSYVHGNLHTLARSGQGKIRNIGVVTRTDHAYRPQVDFRDVDAFELIYTNPANRPLDLALRFLDSTGREITRSSVTVPVRGTFVIERGNTSRDIARVESVSRNALWRPIVFKYYQTHFDVFHG